MKGSRFALRDSAGAVIVIVIVLLFLWLGRQDGRQSPPSSFFGPNHGATSSTRVYYVGDVGTPLAKVDQAYLDRLTAEVAATVTPSEWRRQASISAFETNQSIVVCHTKAGHEQVAKFLAQKRQKAGQATARRERPSID